MQGYWQKDKDKGSKVLAVYDVGQGGNTLIQQFDQKKELV
jgi:hypothetical protein